MTSVERHLDRLLGVLRTTIRESGTTQLEIQRQLGWGRTYISQLLRKQKPVCIDHVVMILSVLGVEPADFYAEVFPAPERPDPGRRRRSRRDRSELSTDREAVRRLRAFLDRLVFVLEQKKLITARELERAVEAAERELHDRL